MTTKIPCAVYARVSSDKQAEGDSIDHQISLAREYIARLGDEYFFDENLIYKDEGISAYSTVLTDRPAIQRMFQDAKEGKFKVAIFKELTRAARDGEENLKVPRYFNRYGVRVIGINDGIDTDQEQAELLMSLTGILAEKESEKIGIRVSSGQREKARKGQWATIAPIGYKINKNSKKLEIDELTAETVRKIFKMYVNDRIGTETIAKHLNDCGIKTPRNTIWDKMSIRRILKNEVYVGTVVYGKHRNFIDREYDDNQNLVAKRKIMIPRKDFIYVEAAHDQIVDKEVFLKAEEIMQSRSKGEYKGNRAKHPLVGLLTCSKCGSSFICQSRSGEKYNYRYYKCSNRHRFGAERCNQDNIPAEELEGYIFNVLMKKLEAVDTSSIHAKGIIEVESLEAKYKHLNNERKKLMPKQFQMTKDRELYTEETFREVMLSIKKEIEFLELQISTIESQIHEISKRKSNYTFLDEMITKIKTINLDNIVEVRSLFHELIDNIEIVDKDTISKIKYRYTFN